MSNRDFVKLSPAFWNGQTGRQLRRAGIEAQLVALYLISSPHANYLGLYSLPVAYISADTGLSLDAVQAALGKIEQTGFARYDANSETVWVLNAAAQQLGDLKAGDNRIKFVKKEFDAVPGDCPFKVEFQAKYGKSLGLGSQPARAPAPKQAELVPAAQPATAPKPAAAPADSAQNSDELEFYAAMQELLDKRAAAGLSSPKDDDDLRRRWLSELTLLSYQTLTDALHRSMKAGVLDHVALHLYLPREADNVDGDDI